MINQGDNNVEGEELGKDQDYNSEEFE